MFGKVRGKNEAGWLFLESENIAIQEKNELRG